MTEDRKWRMALPLPELEEQQVKMVRIAGRQIALFHTAEGIKACDNRCPHEGYPLSEGSLSQGCTLTCNWHNWKFNLETGENLYGGDRLRTYPIDICGNEIWIDITELPYQERYSAITSSLHDAFNDYSYDRITREIARLSPRGCRSSRCASPVDRLVLAKENRT